MPIFLKFSGFILVFAIISRLIGCNYDSQATTSSIPSDSLYVYKSPIDPNGIGKYYRGRQIAYTMGHSEASWLERSEREKEERTDLLLQALKLRPTDVVADIGAGSGYMTFRISPLVPQGKVLAVDVQQEFLNMLLDNRILKNAFNVEPILGSLQNPNLPNQSVDVALLVDSYHEFSYPHEMLLAIKKALKPNGRLVLVEYKAEDPYVPIKALHRMSEKQARKEATGVGLNFVENQDILPLQHILVFRKVPNK
ncbi:class I SAM-dependent methyltransferase [Adhaeribacter radiodurans]|uniref:Methyltransferase domain-containing protein n=1 Tax=Adhaeribacter radiodurans TaxID=2745197 RepID=A0A7L7L316_9BACT|nr:class I SAM-dependent methyltransferase [Adhaeribacter radiodurans]QMU27191.1 methyltransferase domain-containing protein [Adhaeribacter radiodurans]